MKMQRIQEMKKLFINKKNVTNKELCETFGISIETVRRDLDSLQAEGFIRKVYGGASLAELSNNAINVDEWSVRINTNAESKFQMAQKVVELIPEGSTVFLDSGTSVYEVSTLMAQKKSLTVLTNSIRVAEVLGMNPGITVYFIGGVIQPDILASSGIFASEFLSNFYHIEYAIISCDGFVSTVGTTEQSLSITLLKKQILEKTEKTILVVDHSKFGISGSCICCPISKISMVITDSQTDINEIEELQKKSINVVVADDSSNLPV